MCGKYKVKEVNNRFILKAEGYLVTESGNMKKEYRCNSREEAEELKEILEATFPFVVFTIEVVTGDAHA